MTADNCCWCCSCHYCCSCSSTFGSVIKTWRLISSLFQFLVSVRLRGYHPGGDSQSSILVTHPLTSDRSCLSCHQLAVELPGCYQHYQQWGAVVGGARWSSGTALDFRSRGPGFKTTCGRASDFSVEGTGVQNHLLPFQNLGKFVHPTLLVSFGRDTKSRWSLLPGVYARGSKRSHTGGKCVTCCGLRVVVSISNPPIPGT